MATLAADGIFRFLLRGQEMTRIPLITVDRESTALRAFLVETLSSWSLTIAMNRGQGTVVVTFIICCEVRRYVPILVVLLFD